MQFLAEVWTRYWSWIGSEFFFSWSLVRYGNNNNNGLDGVGWRHPGWLCHIMYWVGKLNLTLNFAIAGGMGFAGSVA